MKKIKEHWQVLFSNQFDFEIVLVGITGSKPKKKRQNYLSWQHVTIQKC